MKFAIAALIACTFLVAVPAFEESSFEEDGFPIVARTLNSFYKICKIALRSLKGLNCTIKAVANIKDDTEQFLVDIRSCGAEISKQLMDVINSCKKVVSTSNDILNWNNHICKAGESTITSPKCTIKVAIKLCILNRQMKKTIALIKKVPSIPGDAGVCIQTALNDLANDLRQFPSSITECSKLTS